MDTSSSTFKPGTALKIMTQDHIFLGQFVEMAKQRLELDQKRANELTTLRDSWNPRWKESGVWPLIYPFVAYLDEEIKHLVESNEEVLSRLKGVPDIPSPAKQSEDGFDPLTMTEFLETSHLECRRGYDAVRTADAVMDFDEWFSHAEPEVQTHQTHSISDFEEYRPGVYVTRPAREKHSLVLPEADLEYRNAVAEQHRRVRIASEWCTENHPLALEQLQEHAENVKTLYQGIFSSYGYLVSHLSAACSAAVSSNKEFASTKFIGPWHDALNTESLNVLFEPSKYYNMMVGGETCPPLLGLRPEKAISLIDRLLDHESIFPSSYAGELNFCATDVFDLEKCFKNQADSIANTGQISIPEEKRYIFLKCVLGCSPPLIPLQKEQIDKYRKGVPRARLVSLIETIPPDSRREVLSIALRLLTCLYNQASEPWKRGAELLVHNIKAENIVRDIWRKWDFDRNVCFRAGTARIRN